jgi:4-hydroxybenzoate polyprenyltransferase
MQLVTDSGLKSQNNGIYNFIVREIHLIWQFIYRDLTSTVVPALLFVTAAWKANLQSASLLHLLLGKGLLYFVLYIFSFCVANQIFGIEEDRLNKPNRPLVTGAISLRGAQIRWAISMILFSLVGWLFGVLEWALLWQVVIILHNFGGYSKHWMGKNLSIGVGTVAQLGAAWQLVAPLTPIAWSWILLLAGVWTILVPIQDFRDISGDLAVGRKTFPMVFGETQSRILLSLCLGILPLVVHFVLMMPAGNSWNVILWDIALAAVSLTIAVRMIFYRSPQADHQTYMLFTYWYCLALVSAIFVV